MVPPLLLPVDVDESIEAPQAHAKSNIPSPIFSSAVIFTPNDADFTLNGYDYIAGQSVHIIIMGNGEVGWSSAAKQRKGHMF